MLVHIYIYIDMYGSFCVTLFLSLSISLSLSPSLSFQPVAQNPTSKAENTCPLVPLYVPGRDTHACRAELSFYIPA